jgi:hypothetical protein
MQIISSDEAPSNMRALALKAASTFSATINLASRRALLSPRINFINRKPITRLASTPNIIHGWNIVFPRTMVRADYRSIARSMINQRLTSPTMSISREGRLNASAADIKCDAPILFPGHEARAAARRRHAQRARRAEWRGLATRSGWFSEERAACATTALSCANLNIMYVTSCSTAFGRSRHMDAGRNMSRRVSAAR